MANISVNDYKLNSQQNRLNHLPLNNRVIRRIESLHKNILKFRSKSNKNCFFELDMYINYLNATF